ncbi:hypothetical protein [Helicobacter zhangjianzhongii]|uniref:hypothetical protein n=1 Tax=Helicobacter zhangjianzhongii TaxID=2974574 RepID=UPI002552107D|nr:hypothetical protein [Helicobacter sp. CPD2-1]MDL0079412.1 hypothetical protein [Helicobacter sp. CPD2-1]
MKKVDSRRNAPYVIASGACTARRSIRTPNADSSFKSMDRHASTTALARDDRKTSKVANPNHTTRAARLKNKQSNNSKHAQRRQDFEARIGALQGERGDKTDGLSHKRAEAIHDSSPKDNAKRSKL